MWHPGRHARSWQTSPLQHCASLMQAELPAGKAALHPIVGGRADLAGGTQNARARSAAGITVRAVARTFRSNCTESLISSPIQFFIIVRATRPHPAWLHVHVIVA